MCVDHLLLGMGPALKSGLLPNETPLEKTNLSLFKCLSIGESFRVWDGGMRLLLLFILEPHLVQSLAGPMHTASVSL